VTSDSTVSETLQVKRASERAAYDREAVNAVVDECFIGHVGTIREGLPLVIPMFCVRDGERLLMHGAPATGTVRRGEGTDVCVTMTILDGLVLARSAFHHSMNYRSTVVIGKAFEVSEEADKNRALEMFVGRLLPGRQAYLRPTSQKEIRGTQVLELSLEQSSAKVRTGPPIDEEEDYALDIWAGVVPIRSDFGEAIPDSRLTESTKLPAHVESLISAD